MVPVALGATLGLLVLGTASNRVAWLCWARLYSNRSQSVYLRGVLDAIIEQKDLDAVALSHEDPADIRRINYFEEELESARYVGCLEGNGGDNRHCLCHTC